MLRNSPSKLALSILRKVNRYFPIVQRRINAATKPSIFADSFRFHFHNHKPTMVVEHHVKGYEEFSKLVEHLETSGQTIHLLFTGGKDELGNSWCPYCVKAAPIVQDGLKHAASESHFVYVDVGDRAYWKDLNCPFRKDPRTHLVFLPTLLRWKSPQRLDGEKCSAPDLVEMLFADEI